ncbi:MAG: diaminopimelate epimerase [Bacteroidetes bacterium]|nr:diaminopimelate epimerase [Bacteroidota bacterium]
MKIHFYKYQGCGNDFILVDNRNQKVDVSSSQIKQMCHRNFGIGADGFILLENSMHGDFKMVYYNSDGNPSTLCGNGGRCITAFAHSLGIIKEQAHFEASDGVHTSSIKGEWVSLKMNDVPKIETHTGYFFVNTGSPHVVKVVNEVAQYPVFEEGKKIRNAAPFRSINGTNVNFIQQEGDALFVRTYERGVENETLSCGTGVTAAALVHAGINPQQKNTCLVKTLGGVLEVHYTPLSDGSFTDIWLRGPAVFVFEGSYLIS